MLKLRRISSFSVDSDGHRKVTAYIYADIKSEVTNDITGSDIEGLMEDDELDTGSIAMTASFAVAQLNSSHEWIWKE